MRVLGGLLVSLLVLLVTGWAVLALYYRLPLAPRWTPMVCALWAVFGLATIALWWLGHGGRAVLAFGLGFAVLLSWWTQLQPAQDRPWADDVARHLQSRREGDVVTLDNVRNFDWRSDSDYTVRWESRTYDLAQLRSVDMALSYWMGPTIAHTLVSFGFADGRYLTFSIEIRKERGEAFSAVAGFFKQFELSLVAADERDILRVRTNARGEDVYLYRVDLAPEARRALFLAYLDEARALESKPRFYSTLTANCTTIVYEMVQRIVGGLPLDWRLLASGYLPEYLHGVGGLAADAPLAQLRAAGRITERAKAADADPGFSRAIRQGVPAMEPPP